MRAGRWTAGLVGIITGLVVTACGQQASQTDTGAGQQEQLQVVATTSILGDVTRNVLGDAGQVKVLIEPGTDPHSFEPSAQQIAALREADLVVADGLQLVPALVDPLQAAEQNGANVLRVAEQLNPIPFEASSGHEHDEHAGEEGHSHEQHAGAKDHAHEQHAGEKGHAHGAVDPHVWFDPVRMAEGAKLIGRRIATLAPAQPDAIRTNAQEYAAEVMAMHRRVEDILAAVPEGKRQLVTNHDAFGYLARRYNFEVIGTILPGSSTLSDPSGGQIAELVATIERTNVPAIFGETTAPTRLAETISREVGGDVKVVQLYTGSLAKSGKASTYLGMMIVDAQRIAAGLTTGSVR